MILPVANYQNKTKIFTNDYQLLLEVLLCYGHVPKYISRHQYFIF